MNEAVISLSALAQESRLEVFRLLVNRSSRLVTKFELHELQIPLHGANLRVFLNEFDGTPAGPLSLFDSVVNSEHRWHDSSPLRRCSTRLGTLNRSEATRLPRRSVFDE